MPELAKEQLKVGKRCRVCKCWSRCTPKEKHSEYVWESAYAYPGCFTFSPAYEHVETCACGALVGYSGDPQQVQCLACNGLHIPYEKRYGTWGSGYIPPGGVRK